MPDTVRAYHVHPGNRQSLTTERTILAGREVFLGRRHGPLAILPFTGPEVIASIAYMDPGNFATNIQAGAKYGYEILWVALSANLIAMLFSQRPSYTRCGWRANSRQWLRNWRNFSAPVSG